MNVNGQRTKANLFLVDGISTTSSAEGRGNDFNIPLEAVREFSVQAGSYSAEYGNVAGGVINLESKSGTSEWHGSAFEFFRNDAMDAANFFSNATGQPKNPLHYNQFGGSVGGPVRRDKTFIFGDYQGTITHSGDPMITSVPLAAQRQGDFSDLSAANGALVPIYDPSGASLRADTISQQHDSLDAFRPGRRGASPRCCRSPISSARPANRCLSTTTPSRAPRSPRRSFLRRSSGSSVLRKR